MVFATLFHGIRNYLRLGRGVTTEGLLSRAEIKQVLDRERARAERSGEQLSLVTFAGRAGRPDAATVAALRAALRARLRVTDEAGWLDGRHVCAVLPGTGAVGAWKVADDVCTLLPAGVTQPVCAVYTYPVNRTNRAGTAGRELPLAEPEPRQVVALEELFLHPVRFWKRALDVAGALTGLVVLLPLFAVLAAAVKLTSRGPVLFRQWRSGRGGRPFLMYKFRTMIQDAEAHKTALLELNERDGPAFKIKDDPRVTPVGRFLRMTSLDELPQLWNVLRGDMSLVGPRPLPCSETAACDLWQRRRLDVTPGLTCIWQVRGRGGVCFADWIRMDVQYIRSVSLAHDLKLLALTVPAVLLRKGAN
jgi:lipopolysaccharide/colanic/teichoic acid biosynthesis glycosyltransferase